MWTASQHSKTIEILFWCGRELESLSLHRTYSTESCGNLLFTYFAKLLDFSRVPMVVSITCKKLQNTGSSANEATDRRPRSRQRMIYRTSSFQCNIFVVGPIFSGALCPPLIVGVPKSPSDLETSLGSFERARRVDQGSINNFCPQLRRASHRSFKDRPDLHSDLQ